MNEAATVEFEVCTICKARVRKDRLKRHLIRVHGDTEHKKTIELSEFEGLNIIQAIKRNEQWYLKNASSVSSCEDCRKKITLLQVGENKYKKFDCQKVLSDFGHCWIIRDTHDCDDQNLSTSVYAYSGGIIDSNRRRH